MENMTENMTKRQRVAMAVEVAEQAVACGAMTWAEASAQVQAEWEEMMDEEECENEVDE